MDKNKILQYAIKSINRYNNYSEGDKVGSCKMCDLIPKNNNFWLGHDCTQCPFYCPKKNLHCRDMDQEMDLIGYDARYLGLNLKQWKSELNSRLKKWRKKVLDTQ